MSAQATATDGKSWALSTLGAVPAETPHTAQELGTGRRPILAWWADIATAIDQSWRRRDLVWVGLPILLAFLCDAH